MARSFDTSLGNSNKFGHKDYHAAKRSGASDTEIKAFLDRSPHLLWSGNAKGSGGLYDEIASSAAASKATYAATTSDSEYKSQIADYKAKQAQHDSKIADYDKRISAFNDQLSGYKIKVDDLTGKYNTALATEKATATERDDFAKKFRDATAQYEQEKLTADVYRNEAVNYQLQGVRSGATAGGANQTSTMRGSLTTGKTGYSSDDGGISDLAASMKGQGGLTDSVLNNKGAVVQQLNSGAKGPSGGGQRRMQSGAGSGSYYASRFR